MRTPGIRAMLLGILIATIIFEVPLAIFGNTSGWTVLVFFFGVLISALTLCGPLLVLGLPLSIWLRAKAPQSVIAHVIALLVVAGAVPAVALMRGYPLPAAIAFLLVYAFFDILALGIALALDRRIAHRVRPRGRPDLAKTFE